MQAAREWGEESAHRIVQLDTQKLERRPERGSQRPAGRVGGVGGIIYNTGKRPVYPRVHNTCPLGVYRYSRAGSAGRHWPSDGNQRKIKRHDNNSGQGVRLDRSPRMDGRMEPADLYDKQGRHKLAVVSRPRTGRRTKRWSPGTDMIKNIR